MSFCQVLLKLFNNGVHELNMDAAPVTNKMVMMLVSQLLFVSHCSIAQIHGTSEARIHQ